MRKHTPTSTLVALLLGVLAVLASCTATDDEYDPYYNWQERNTQWFGQVMDSARTAISQARLQYGDAWEEHCDWRMYKSLNQSPTYQSGKTDDSICVRILAHGNGTVSPTFSDTVRIAFRGWLMPTTDAEGNKQELIFTQTYYGTYDPSTAAPQTAAVSSFRPGFGTALQYMVADDDWMVYMPANLFYGTTTTGVIPAYSAARFRIHMMAIYPFGTNVPAWK